MLRTSVSSMSTNMDENLDDCIRDIGYSENIDYDEYEYEDDEYYIEEEEPRAEPNICGIFVEGNDIDYEICDDEDSLFERVWLTIKPPKIPDQTRIVSARRVQVMKERLSSTINAPPSINECLARKASKGAPRTRHVEPEYKYVRVHEFDAKAQASCQDDAPTVIPQCAFPIADII